MTNKTGIYRRSKGMNAPNTMQVIYWNTQIMNGTPELDSCHSCYINKFSLNNRIP